MYLLLIWWMSSALLLKQNAFCFGCHPLLLPSYRQLSKDDWVSVIEQCVMWIPLSCLPISQVDLISI